MEEERDIDNITNIPLATTAADFFDGDMELVRRRMDTLRGAAMTMPQEDDPLKNLLKEQEALWKSILPELDLAAESAAKSVVKPAEVIINTPIKNINDKTIPTKTTPPPVIYDIALP